MATKTTKTAAPKTETAASSTALVRKAPEEMEAWEAAMFADAEKAVGQEAGVGGGNFFSIRAGQLSINGNPIPGNEIAVAVLDSVTLKTFYAEKFDPDSMGAPVCYAFGRDDNIAPHEAVKTPCSDKCFDCANNEFGTADGGNRKGKACADRRRLAVITAGTMVNGTFHPTTNSEDLRKAEIAFFTVPPTSIKEWANYCKGLKASIQRPPYAVFTLIKVTPDAKKQVAVSFTLLAPAPKDAVMVLSDRHREAEEKIIFPFPSPAAEEKKPAAPAGKQPRNKFAK
jgi:hypothetical protein